MILLSFKPLLISEGRVVSRPVAAIRSFDEAGYTNIAELTQAHDSRKRQDILRQAIKWTVYALLLINWGYYIFDDWRVARHTLDAGEPLLQWMNAYATSIDELAWFALLFLFELETYWLSDAALTRVRRFIFVGIRLACYGFLLHTLYAYGFSYLEIVDAVLLPSATTACELAGQDFSFLRNLLYTDIGAGNCNALSAGGALFQIGGDSVITDTAGLAEYRGLAIIDIVEATVWLAVIIIIELVVVLQERGTSAGKLISRSNYLTIGLYSILVSVALYWIWKGHYVYAWDELLWIGGFAAIEMNLSEWRDELDAAAVHN